MNSPNALEQRIAAAYRCQMKHYDDALRIVNEDALTFDPAIWANRLQSALKQIAVVEQGIKEDKLAWVDSKCLPGAELRDILAKIATQIQELAAAIDRRSNELLARKQRLAPVLDEFIRHRKMMQSYVQYSNGK